MAIASKAYKEQDKIEVVRVTRETIGTITPSFDGERSMTEEAFLLIGKEALAGRYEFPSLEWGTTCVVTVAYDEKPTA